MFSGWFVPVFLAASQVIGSEAAVDDPALHVDATKYLVEFSDSGSRRFRKRDGSPVR
jgi:hypothetical protein